MSASRRRRGGDVRRREGPARLAPAARRPSRRRVGRDGEDGRGIDAPARLGRPESQGCKGLTKQHKTAPKLPDLVNRDFTAAAPNRKWCGDVTEIPTADGKLYLAAVIDLYSRRRPSRSGAARPRSTMWCSTPTGG